ncbi:unnamed protein product [Cuscuta campestris]|uniref:Morc S5 domain-containing protein n=1 Tax=Cuscuta campestris TaxID=132261 RepID=A0A484MWW0_9ASTE|nr:unnamed protein product [Cuscuta campestris]
MEPAVVKAEAAAAEEEAAIVPGIAASHGLFITDGGSLYDGFDDHEDYWEEDMDGTPGPCRKKARAAVESALPLGFLDPLPPEERACFNSRIRALPPSTPGGVESGNQQLPVAVKPEGEACVPAFQRCKQFWKAGDYEGTVQSTSSPSHYVAIDHVRVHPKFLHSNATSHKWALGAFAELLDNALDEVCNGATYVNVDVLNSNRDNSRILLVEDNGGGMTPDKMRQCMSLGYSAKSKMANTIGQYGNGFKTSSMRLGADVVVFSRCQARDGRSPTQSIGMLSYSFLRGTGKEDIVVPMIDFEKRGESWDMMIRSSVNDWNRNLETIMQWSPYLSEDDLLQQFDFLNDQGTRIIIYNLWEDDEGSPELDFDTDQHDIQIRGVNRDEKKIAMAKTYPDSTHFLTYQHSLRSYASILYLKLPSGFRIILRGEDVEHHNLVNDMMLSKEITYRPQPIAGEHAHKNPNLYALVNIGFAKDAKYHIDIQGFNVYHKNRLIKPFWRVWNAAGSDGRGVIGVLEANFIEPAHDKQGFERTIVLARLENRLQSMQKEYWVTNCHLIGYAKRRDKKSISPAVRSKSSSRFISNDHCSDKSISINNVKLELGSDTSYENVGPVPYGTVANPFHAPLIKEYKRPGRTAGCLALNLRNFSGDEQDINCTHHSMMIHKMKEENFELKKSLEAALNDLQFERDRNLILENKILTAGKMSGFVDKDRELAYGFAEELVRKEEEEERLRSRLKDASETIQDLLDKVKMLEDVCINLFVGTIIDAGRH